MRIFCAYRGSENGSELVYALLKYAMESLYGTEKLPEIEKTKNGKPYFRNLPDIHFSLSHSITHVLCAVSEHPVGCDIESPRKIAERTVRYFSSPAELSQFEPIELWVLKESYVKLFSMRLPDVKTIRFSKLDEKIIAPDPKVRSSLYAVSGCLAAVCSLCAEPAAEIEIVAERQLSLSPH